MAALAAPPRRASLPCALAAWSSPEPWSIAPSRTNCATLACPKPSISAAGENTPKRKTENPDDPSGFAWRQHRRNSTGLPYCYAATSKTPGLETDKEPDYGDSATWGQPSQRQYFRPA